MTEPRMRLRNKGQQFPSSDSPQSFTLEEPYFQVVIGMPIPPKSRVPLNRPAETTFDTQTVEAFLIAFGDDDRPLSETVKCLDEIVTDYIIETCHEAASVAHHARRAKIKLDDFKFMLRRDTTKLGRVSEMLETDKELKRKRKAFDTDEGAVAKDPGVQDGDTGGHDKDKDKGGAKEAGKEGGHGKGGAAAGDEGGERKKKKKKKKKEKRRDADVGRDDASTVRSG